MNRGGGVRGEKDIEFKGSWKVKTLKYKTQYKYLLTIHHILLIFDYAPIECLLDSSLNHIVQESNSIY